MVVTTTMPSHTGPVSSNWYGVNRRALRSNRTRSGMILSARTAGLTTSVTDCNRSAPGAVAERLTPDGGDQVGRSAVTRGCSAVKRANSAVDVTGAMASRDARYVASPRIVGWSYRSVGG